MNASALWQRLDTPGHDAASIRTTDAGFVLDGMAVFRHDDGPASVAYTLELERDWVTRRAEVGGHLGGRPFRHIIEREPDGWYLDGCRQEGVPPLPDLDLGFTPATNLQQMHRALMRERRSVALDVAWFDLGMDSLAVLPQRYERRGERTFWYEAPTAAYTGLLEVMDSGFIAVYPGLWRAC